MTFSQYELKKLSAVLLVEHLHLLSDGLPVRQDVAQVPGAQHIPQGGGGQQPGGPAVVVHVGHGADRILKIHLAGGVIGIKGRGECGQMNDRDHQETIIISHRI